MQISRLFIRSAYLFLLSLCWLPTAYAQPIAWDQLKSDPWVDSVLLQLTPTERIAQLFMVAAYSNRDVAYEKELNELVSKNKLGGIIFFQGGPIRQAVLTNELQKVAEVPLLVAMDAEWGLAMRLDSTTRFPYHMTLGAVNDPHLIYETGRAIARHCRRLGVHVNFGPVVDINNNPANPVINFRSFGENREEVAWRAFEYTKGLQDGGVLAVAKHFPGHGDTDVDSHLDLPVIPHSRRRLDSLELYPFRFLFNQGVGGVMVAHLNVPELDNSGQPTTLSQKVVTGLLKEEMQYGGLVFTDALNMKGVTKHFEPGMVDLQAFLAGNDIMLFSENVEEAIKQIVEAARSGVISAEDIDERCRKVLAAKLWAGLNKSVLIDTAELIKDLNTPEDAFLNFQLAEAAVTLLENKADLIPLQLGLDTLKIATVAIGSSGVTEFQSAVEKYTALDHFFVPKDAAPEIFENTTRLVDEYDLVIFSLHSMAVYPKNNFGVPESAIGFLNKVAGSGKAVIAVFGNPYFLSSVSSIKSAEAVILGYQETPETQKVAAQIIFGGIGASGHLPVSVGDGYRQGWGEDTEGGLRFKYTLPEELGITSGKLEVIDSIVHAALKDRAVPGCEVLVSVDQKIIFQKSFGYHTYDSLIPVENHHLYDLASVTKVSGALPALMKLYGEGRLNLDAALEYYAPSFKGSAVGSLPLREILAHQSGLMPYIPYWKGTLRGIARNPWQKGWDAAAINQGKFKWHTFKSDSTVRFPVRVSDDLWLYKNYKKKIFKSIKHAPIGEKKYLYSGLIFLVFPEIIEKISGVDYHEYLYGNFYHPMGAYDITYHPLNRHPLNEVVPTELDDFFRMELIHGDVHDEAASMMNRRSSNAGLFANANDLAKLGQMYVNYGTYGGVRYLEEEAVREFARCQYCEEGNKRGLGFDRQRDVGNTATSASASSFGHSGFTGTFIWMDPKYNLVYVFLSNRVYPTRENTLLYQMNVRTDILQAVYEAIPANP